MKNKITTIILTILICVFAAVVFTACGKCKHVYDNACDTTCNKCDETREVGEHTPEADDGNCLTARNCTVCEQVAVAGNVAHSATDTDENWTCDNPGCEQQINVTLNGLIFALNDDGESCSVTGITEDFAGTEVTIPSTVNGKPVTEIGEGAFIGCTSLSSIYYEGKRSDWDNNVNVGDGAIPDNATVYYYSSDMPTAEGNYWYYENGEPAVWKFIAAEQIIFELNAYEASYLVTGLKSGFEGEILIIPATYGEGDKNYPVTEINYDAFRECTELTSVTIPDSVTSIGASAFYSCTSLKSVTFGENSKLKKISENAFGDCSSLESVTIPDSVTLIGADVFYECSTLTSVYYGGTDAKTWETLSTRASLRRGATVYYYSANEPTTAGDYWYYVDGKIMVWPTDADTIVELNGLIFKLNESRDSYAVIDLTEDFNGTEVIIPSTCSGKPVTAIGISAFYKRTALTSVTIPSSVTEIGMQAFYRCPLESVYYGGTEADWGDKDKITIGDNAIPTYSTVYYYSEEKPEGEGNYWHYDANGVPTTEWDD